MTGTIFAIIAALIGGGAGTALLQGVLNRKRDAAAAAKLAAAAHGLIYEQYGVLLDELRQDAAMSRQEAASARADATDARNRAAVAEARAAGAETRATAAEAQLTEMRALVMRHVPNADDLLRSFAQLAGLTADRNANQSTPTAVAA